MPSSAANNSLKSHHGEIAYHRINGKEPSIIFLPGYRSAMTGSKALALENYCQSKNRAFVRFDYRGHGESGGDFMDKTLGDWIDDALSIIDINTEESSKPPLLVGSSMGVWIAMHVALLRPVSGIVGVAAGVDFTADFYARLNEGERQELESNGVIWKPSKYDMAPYPYTKKLLEDAKQNWLLLNEENASIPLHMPIRLLHGMEDCDVEWINSVDIATAIEGKDVTVTLLKNGDHRLSKPDDQRRIIAAVEEILAHKLDLP